MPYVEVKDTIRLTDKDGIMFDLDIDAVKEAVNINSIKGVKTVIHVIDGSEIAVQETASEVMQKIVNARFGI